MMEILQFIFSDFWIWLGTLFLLCAVGAILSETVKGIFKK